LFPVCLLPGQRVRDAGLLNRAQGCLLGQVAGDSLGGLVEFSRPEAVERLYPGGPRLLEDGGHWGLLAGQPTDDSELALSLARTLLAEGGYRPERAFRAYQRWYGSAPFDVGSTTSQALGLGRPSTRSQANGALMRVSPLGPAGWGRGDEALEWAAADCRLTHPHPFCVAANQLYVGALLMALAGASPREIYDWALGAAGGEAREVLEAAARRPPEDYLQHAGWVRVALHNAFYRLLHASSLEEGVVETVRCGGDTDTNGAIAGALLGAVHGRRAVPAQWQRMVLSCRPHPAFRPCRRPRPSIFWPVDVAELAERLLLL
ncbi:MAG TPA: ADP-ribosylglycohydrolase family protein, partial [Candidatus Nitrosotenuis sp.]|nr:ADP-ribosylglycohydrolase family protein [Candidatus Nitrosotenuis sp.]